MEKYLFINGSNGIKELHSAEELESQIRSVSDPSSIRIWPFGGKEWLTLVQYRRLAAPAKIVSAAPSAQAVAARSKPPASFRWISRLAIMAVLIIAAIFIYNFTRISWSPAPPLTVNAARPENTPPLNVDSLITAVEYSRGVKLDRVTRTNLRIRNTWPDRILLSFRSNRDTIPEATRFTNRSVTLDNATGYFITNAAIRVDTWEKGNLVHTDTLTLKGIDYTEPVTRELPGMTQGDSVSVAFVSIQSPVFNFCYSADKQSNYGNLNDRWFCKD